MPQDGFRVGDLDTSRKAEGIGFIQPREVRAQGDSIPAIQC